MEIEKQPDWKKYEQAAARILDELANHFGFANVEGTQLVPGRESGTDWRIDAKGVSENDEVFVIIECRRYTTSKINQEETGGLAYRIRDTGAVGGIFVTPLGLQKEPKKSPPQLRSSGSDSMRTIRLNSSCLIAFYA